MIKESLEQVQKKIRAACERAGRNPKEVTLIAVSKTKPNEILMEAYDEGVRIFGENKVQELVQKMDTLPKDIEWHMIGHLQRNKVKYIAGRVALIHSVDSYRLAEEINIQALKRGIIIPILVEVNISEEKSKFGVYQEDVRELIRQISELGGVEVRGLMTIAPYVVDPEENRPIFHKIKELAIDIEREKLDNVNMLVLSMGMTNDYEVAIEEGATMVRVGTAIFGERSYNN
ncbi:MAG: YggS family pyridoxal phosphate-dependent enzyme [Lachnospiraceae bacterium]|nr:YggS family pyridoxal phosphate-dependent enzyme [Lachnospiraceae bacterium]